MSIKTLKAYIYIFIFCLYLKKYNFQATQFFSNMLKELITTGKNNLDHLLVVANVVYEIDYRL